MSLPTLYQLAKEAMAAGQASIALATVRAVAKTAPARAVLASIEAAVKHDEDIGTTRYKPRPITICVFSS